MSQITLQKLNNTLKPKRLVIIERIFLEKISSNYSLIISTFPSLEISV
jgi:hypothetical protein